MIYGYGLPVGPPRLSPLRLGGRSLITVPEMAAKALGSFLAKQMSGRFGSTHAELTELIPSAARLALECIGNSDALYHNVEHTMLVTFAGYDIMRGRALVKPTDAGDFAHVILACLFHDIGYVRGILEGDGSDSYVTDTKGGKTSLPRGSSDAVAYALPRRQVEAVRDGPHRSEQACRCEQDRPRNRIHAVSLAA